MNWKFAVYDEEMREIVKLDLTYDKAITWKAYYNTYLEHSYTVIKYKERNRGFRKYTRTFYSIDGNKFLFKDIRK